MRLESKINPKFLTLSENTVWCVPTITVDGKQRQEDREGVEKRMASVYPHLVFLVVAHPCFYVICK